MALRLAHPTECSPSDILQFKNDFKGEVIYGGARLDNYDQLSDWFEHIKTISSKQTVPEGRSPSSTFFTLSETNDLIGIVNIRHDINQEFLYQFSGHIGYSIHPQYRQKGYGKEQLALALNYCKLLGISKVLITCDDDNIASEHTILALGGQLEDMRFEPNRKVWIKRFWIQLSSTP